ncbi:MAG: hypothetical protein AB1671_08580 [Thermodesulfobacteriota bacterium]
MTIDRYGYPLMGRRHLWIILAQLGLCINFVLLALVPDPAANLPLLSLMGFTLSFFFVTAGRCHRRAGDRCAPCRAAGTGQWRDV